MKTYGTKKRGVHYLNLRTIPIRGLLIWFCPLLELESRLTCRAGSTEFTYLPKTCLERVLQWAILLQ